MRDVHVQPVAQAGEIRLQVIIESLPGDIRRRNIRQGNVVQQTERLLADHARGDARAAAQSARIPAQPAFGIKVLGPVKFESGL